MKIKTPYSERSDSDKVFANWSKTIALYEQNEFSMAVVRAAVTIELAANLVVRAELISKRKLEPDFVEHLLRWANGLANKITHFITPLLQGDPDFDTLSDILKLAQKISSSRNSVAHSGHFITKGNSLKLITDAHQVLTELIGRYVNGFEIGLTSRDQVIIKSGKKSKKKRLFTFTEEL
ncbi:hypothetical protein [Geomonas edaphica]|uniref:hypothetical protein n=1 Tax=Geomonas edaphica TaxID=2570226 RepID=UPI0010A771E4|nr:hypothetical protein [Geomonas edaphica]